MMFDPYKDKECGNVRATVGRDDIDLINSVMPFHGIVSTVARITFFAVAADLRSEGITTYTPENAEKAYAIVLKRLDPNNRTHLNSTVRSSTPPAEPLSRSDDAGGKNKSRARHSTSKSDDANTKSRNPGV